MTPMMEQYMEVKNQYKDYLLFYRLGDFYEMFFDDAITASRELELTLTGRDCGEEERAPMCGVPFHAADVYIGKLIEKGYKVAVCGQMEDPALAGVRRFPGASPDSVVFRGEIRRGKVPASLRQPAFSVLVHQPADLSASNRPEGQSRLPPHLGRHPPCRPFGPGLGLKGSDGRLHRAAAVNAAAAAPER